MTGKGHPSALLGSSDGWLYSVNPCNGALDFALPFDAAVGTPIFGDTDGDGHDEAIVPVADGYLYGLKNEAVGSPPFVWDTDPAHGVEQDVADIETKDTLSGRWGAVDGATAYEIAVVDSVNAFVGASPWTSRRGDQRQSFGALLKRRRRNIDSSCAQSGPWVSRSMPSAMAPWFTIRLFTTEG